MGRPRYIDYRLPGWRAARYYGVSAAMVEQATRRRLAGDWRGACGAARVEVDLDLGAVRDQYGAGVATAMENDLLHLAPDLMRWHMLGLHTDGSGLLRARHHVALATYDGGVRLFLRTPAGGRAGERIGLVAGPNRVREEDNWTRARHLWDVRAAHQLLAHAGGGDRTPFVERDGRRRAVAELGQPATDPAARTEQILGLADAGQIEEAWAAAGIRVGDDFTAREVPPIDDTRQPLAEIFACLLPTLVHVARAILTAPPAPPEVAVRVPQPHYLWDRTIVKLRLENGEIRADRAPIAEADSLPVVPLAHWQRLADVELLRAGMLGPEELHPLVRAALFPHQPDPGFHPRVGRAARKSTEERGYARDRLRRPTPAAWAGEAFPVRCRGVWHRIGWRDGRLTPLDHTADEVTRERVMRSLGGAVPTCVTVVDTWLRRHPGKPARFLRDLRRHTQLVMLHGRVDELLRLLDSGLDPALIRDDRGRGLLHHLAKLDNAVPALTRLLAEGLDINARDDRDATPLQHVRYQRGSAELIAAMIDAGAIDPKERG